MVQGGRKASHKSFSGTWFESCGWENSFWTNQLFFILIKDLNWNQVFAFLWLRTTKMIETRFLFILFIDVLFILSDAKDSLWCLGDQTQLSSSPLLASNSRWMKIQLKNAETCFNFNLRDPNMLRKRREPWIRDLRLHTLDVFALACLELIHTSSCHRKVNVAKV